ncbi:MAG: hypothetical protein J0I13_06770 [Rhizobiales bacterium]|jgi:hypothetical protein|nr:hypothetical protein [Hyphomicrobiales bacterium]
MPPTDELRDGREEQVQEWLLLLLRFAISRNESDEAAACALDGASRQG